MRDRTSEFLACCESVRSSYASLSIPPSEDRMRLMQPHSSKTDFAKAASAIGRDINAVTVRLQRLTALAKRKTLFDDRPVEINELVYIIKQDIAKINRQIGLLSEYLAKDSQTAEVKANNPQTKEHSHNVITSLQSKLASTSDEFKNILQVRFDNMQEQKTRRDQYSTNPSNSQLINRNTGSDSLLFNPERRSTLNESETKQSDALIDFGSQDQQQQQMIQPNNAQMDYIQSRSEAIESIESTIAELGQIYQNFAAVLAGQREMVQRIDDNVVDMEMNVDGAHSQLAKYYQNISSNRGLMLKMFGVILIFFLAFVLMT